MSGQRGVEPARALGECGEGVVAGGQANAGADGGDVVQVAPLPLELEQDRADAAELCRRHQPERMLAGARVGDAVRHCAGGAGAHREGESFVELLAFGGALEAAVLVEEARVEVEDPVADDVEAEVARLDHAGVDRPDRDLIRIGASDRNRPPRELEIVLDERPQRLVPGEADSLQIVRLALVPAGRGSEIDDRGGDSLLCGNGLEARGPVLVGDQRADECSVRGRVQAGEAPAVGECRRRPVPVGGEASWTSRQPSDERVDELGAGQPDRGGGRARAGGRRDAGERRSRAAQPGRLGAVARGAAAPPVVSISAWASPRKPSASRSAVALAAQGCPAWKPPATISTSLTKSGEGGSPASAPSEMPIDAPRAGLACARCR